MPILSHMRWVQKHFLADPVVQNLQPKVRIKNGSLTVTSAWLKADHRLVFNRDSVSITLDKNGRLLDMYECLDMFPVRVGRHQFECEYCFPVDDRQRFSSVRQMYLDHCIEPMLEYLRNGKYLRSVG